MLRKAIGCIAVLCCASFCRASVIAHWSFDSSSLTTDGSGNIIGTADETGNHNGSLGSGVGSGTGHPYTSNTIPGSNSIAGEYGQGLTLTGFNTLAGGGGQFLTFPNLTELMSAGSAGPTPSYTVSYWINTTTTNSQQFTVLGDWGNGSSNPGKFTYGYGISFSGSTPQMRGQARFNTSGSGNGTDIYARSVNTPSLNDGNWHMLTWTFDTSTGMLNSYLDGSNVESFTSAAANFNMILSNSTLGTFGLKGDSGNFLNGTISLDEAWVLNGALDAAGVQQLFQTNTVTVPEPGAIALIGGVGLLLGGAGSRRRMK